MEKIKVNQDVCISCGACCGEYPEHLEMSDEGVAQAIEGKNTVSEEEAEEIVGICPVGAISSEKTENNE